MPKILLPAGWTAEQDCACFVERWEPVPSYTTALWKMMRFHYGAFVETLDNTLRCLGRKHLGLVHVEPGCLTPDEKIVILQEIARSSAWVAGYREELLELLAACAIAESERQRVVREYRMAGEHAWMYPVIEVIDYLGGSAFHLDGLMSAEEAGFREMTAES